MQVLYAIESCWYLTLKQSENNIFCNLPSITKTQQDLVWNQPGVTGKFELLKLGPELKWRRAKKCRILILGVRPRNRIGTINLVVWWRSTSLLYVLASWRWVSGTNSKSIMLYMTASKPPCSSFCWTSFASINTSLHHTKVQTWVHQYKELQTIIKDSGPKQGA